jgi:hypothetical protein
MRNRRPSLRFEAFAETRLSAAPITRKSTALIDRLTFYELAEQKGRRRYSKGGVGQRLWSWGEEASDPRREVQKFRLPLEPTRRVDLRRAWREAGTPG